MTSNFNIYFEVEDAKEALESLGANSRRIRNYLLKSLGREGAKKAKKAYSHAGLKKRSSKLYKSITSWTGQSGRDGWAYVGPKRKSRSKEDDISYGYMLAHGYKVTPKTHVTKWERKASGTKPGDKYIKFKNSHGKWITVKDQFTVSSHDFVVGPVQKWMHSPDYYNKVDELIDRQVQKAMERKRLEDK